MRVGSGPVRSRFGHLAPSEGTAHSAEAGEPKPTATVLLGEVPPVTDVVRRACDTVLHRRSTVGTVEIAGEHPPGFAVVDLETTGFSPEQERIVEVAVVILSPAGEEVDTFCTLVDPGRDPGPTHVHGISEEMLVGAPSFAEIHPYLADRLSGRVIVGHNVDRFDLAFLWSECRRAGGEALVPGNVATVDTLRVAQLHLGLRGKARLVDCCDHFGLSWDDHHSALGDTRVTASLFRSMREHLGDGPLGIAELLLAARACTWPGASGQRSMTRGRTGSLTG
jgi:DNA polymerase III epsilon subunit-like protein